MQVAVLSSTEPSSLVAAVRGELARMDPTMALADVRSMEQVLLQATRHLPAAVATN